MTEAKKQYYRKYVELFPLVSKMKLWPSKSGALHGVRTVELRGEYLEISTHCGETFLVRNSRHSRGARWLRNKWAANPCSACRVPDWKLEKYARTFFSPHYGKELSYGNTDPSKELGELK